MSPDPLSDMAPNWTHYKYSFDNPLVFVDPNGLWEFDIVGEAGESKGVYKTFLKWQEGDNLITLAEQTGFSILEIKGFFSESIISDIEGGKPTNLFEFGGYLTGINEALNFESTTECNCWGTALSYGETGNVDITGGIDHPKTADQRLLNNFSEKRSPRIGDVIRYARQNGYKDMDLNQDGNVNISDERIRIRLRLIDQGNKTGGTSHFATFLLSNNSGTQVFTKNGWVQKWRIMYENKLPATYGERSGINGGSSIFRKK